MVVGADGRLPLPWLEAPLRDALAHQRGHALLVQAADGVGALEFMFALAQAWLCEAQGTTRPCGVCESCRLLQARSHPDLYLLLPEALRVSLGWAGQGDDDSEGKNRRKPSRQIRIDEVRAAVDWVVQTSARGRAKVVVIHPAGAMNLQAASALLKTLEEPPGQARLLLSTTDEASLLPTVRSRCQALRLGRAPAEAATAWLGGQGLAADDARVLLAACSGRPLEAAGLAAAGVDARAWGALPSAVAAGQAAVLTGWGVVRAVDALYKLCLDALAMTQGAAPRFFPVAPALARADATRLAAWSRDELPALGLPAAEADQDLRNFCFSGGYLAAVGEALPADPADYDARGLPVRGCNRLRCQRCSATAPPSWSVTRSAISWALLLTLPAVSLT